MFKLNKELNKINKKAQEKWEQETLEKYAELTAEFFDQDYFDEKDILVYSPVSENSAFIGIRCDKNVEAPGIKVCLQAIADITKHFVNYNENTLTKIYKEMTPEHLRNERSFYMFVAGFIYDILKRSQNPKKKRSNKKWEKKTK